jgi:hypothetical protein
MKEAIRQEPVISPGETLLDLYKLQRGIYARVARRSGVDPSFVSRVANGERTSAKIRRAVLTELTRVHSMAKGIVNCPICAAPNVTPLEKKNINIPSLAGENNGKMKPVAAFRCTAAHTFFVCHSDLRPAKARKGVAQVYVRN